MKVYARDAWIGHALGAKKEKGISMSWLLRVLHCTGFALMAVAKLAGLPGAFLCGSVLSPTFSKRRMLKAVLNRSRACQSDVSRSST
jgi:hypothetical protein